jgi:hypothetical protein
VITVRQILDAAYAKSAKSRPSVALTEATEGVLMVARAVRGLYAYAARVNPIFFAEFADVGISGGNWARPPAAESIFRLEQATGLFPEVVVVPFDDRKAEPSKPAVYELGQKFYSAGNPTDPVAGSLRFWYAKRPTDPTLLTDTIDVMWVESYNELVILEVAIYLAIKDGRAEDLGQFREQRNSWATLFSAFLEHSTANLRSRFGQVRRFTTQTMIPLQSLLAGEKQA